MSVVLRRSFTMALSLALLVTLAFAGIRLATPWLAGHRETLESLASASLDRPVSIGAIDAAWRGLDLNVRLRDVTVKNASGQVLLSFDEARATPDLMHSLGRRRLALASLHVTGARLHIIRAHGKLTARGIRRRQHPTFAADAERTVSLRDSRIFWEDRQLDVNYRLRHVDATLDAGGGNTRLRARFALAASRAARLVVAADLQTLLTLPASGLRGTFYLQGEQLPASKLRANIARGTAALQVWGHVENGAVARVVGTAGIEDARLADGWQLESVGLKFGWRHKARGWQMRIEDLEVTSAGRGWRATAAGLDSRAARNGQTAYRGWLSNAKVEDLLALAPNSDSIDALRPLMARAPTGELRETWLSARIEKGQLLHYRAHGRFHDLSLAADADAPGFAGADGRFAFSRSTGTLALRTHGLEIQYPRLFDGPSQFDRLRGDVCWRRENERLVMRSPKLSLSNEDFAASGPFELRLGAGRPYLNTRIALSRGEVAKVADYLPVKILSPRATEWLKQALVAGRLVSGDVHVRGDIADFPFRHSDGNGEFEARFDVEQGILDYRPGWPRVEAARAEVRFSGPSVSVTGARAQVLDSQIDAATVLIPDLREGELQLSLAGHGPVEDIAQYLQRSVLAESNLFERLTVSGDSRLALALRLPLSKDSGEEPEVSGRVTFDRAGLRIAPPGLDFNGIEGELAFSPEGFRAENINGRFRGHKVTAGVAPGEDKRTIVSVRGRLPASALLADVEHPLVRQLRGASLWQARLGLPAIGKPPADAEPRPLGFSLVSSLQGTTVDLPQPLLKRAAERRLFRVVTAFGGDEQQHPVRAQYGPDLSAVLLLTGDKGGMRIERGALSYARGLARLPRVGVTVKAAFAEFSVEDWARQLQAETPGTLEKGGASISLRQLDVAARRLRWSGRTFDKLRIEALQRNGRWMAQVRSAQVAGRVVVPADRDSPAPLVANLEHLDLQAGQDAGHGTGAAMDARELPPLRVTAKALRIGEFEFSDARLETSRMKNGLRVRKLELSAPNFEGRAQGAWYVGEAAQKSRFDLVLNSDNLGELLQRWDLQHSMRDGIAHVEARLDWPDAPARFDLAHLSGQTSLRVTDGRLRGLDPGPGRLLGLFNLGAIQRRLSLDFSDLFRTGFSFDTMAGDLAFRDANMYTENTVIDGPAALIKITGRTGLVAHDYDQRVVVVPKIMSGLPLAGAL
ncbi:MAG: TIGR02099 family protein, partial [Gammaproteobacteria bacterium]|nr:TIGR02099 family protein [Gammaproteobacteria bacterium]